MEKNLDHMKMKEWVSHISEDDEMHALFLQLLEPSNFHGDLFFLNKDIVSPKLFSGNVIPDIVNVRLTYFGLSERDIEHEITIPLNMEKDIERDKTDDEDDSDRETGMVDEQTSIKIRQLFIYLVLKTVKTLPNFEELINMDPFTFEEFQKKTRGGNEIDLEASFSHFSDDIEKDPSSLVKIKENDSGAIREGKKLLTEIVKGFTFDPLKPLQTFPWDLLLLEVGKTLVAYHQGKISSAGIVKKQYISILQELHDRDILSTYWSCWYCEECNNRVEPQEGNNICICSRSQLKLPMQKLICPGCGKRLHSFSILRPNDHLCKMINSKDGLISVAVAFFLEQKNIDWTFSEYNGEMENDFVIRTENTKYILEIKMVHLKIDKNKNIDYENLQKKIKQGRNQLLKHLEESNADKGFLIFNQRQKILERSQSGRKKYNNDNIEVIGWDKILEKLIN